MVSNWSNSGLHGDFSMIDVLWEKHVYQKLLKKLTDSRPFQVFLPQLAAS